MQKFTCLTCRVHLTSVDTQREHYKCGWHIYNIKRKVSSLAPVPEDQYLRLLEEHTAPTDSQDSDEEKEKEQAKVKAQEEAKEESPAEEKEGEEEETEPESIPVTECLFCSLNSKTMEMNVEHMSSTHSFFIPDLDYCSDLEGLLDYLGMKIADGRECLYCSEFGKQFASKKSAQQHMLAKGHAKIKFDYSDFCLEEFEDFYDYTASYPEGEEGGDDDVNEDDMQIIPEDYQLRLPSGATIGHRSLNVYYKQNLRPQRDAPKESNNRQLVSKVMSQYQLLGWTGISAEGAKRRAKDIQKWQRQQQRAHLHLGKAGNKTLTLHFRCQTGQC